MQKKRALIIALSTVAVIIVALLVIPSFIDWSKYQSVAKTKVKEATGYDLSINGSFSIALLPSPHANISNVILNKPVTGHADTFLTFDNADVRIALLPLLVGKIEVASVTLDKPVVTMVTYKDGTDNYTPVKPVDTDIATTDPVTGQPVAATATTGEDQSIAVNAFRIKDGRVLMRNEADNTSHEIGIKDLHVKADTLSGPFDGDGKISYGDANFNLSMSTGGYKKGESLPVQLMASDTNNRLDVKYSGVAATGDPMELQGEMNVTAGDLQSLLKDMGIAASVPPLGEQSKLSGMITLTSDRVSLTNGALEIGKTKFKTKAEITGLKTAPLNVAATFDSPDLLDVDALMKVADKVVASEKKQEKAQEKTAAKTATPSTAPAKPLVPADFTLPKTMKADIKLSARGVHYHDTESGALALRVTAADGKGDARATVADIPGGGNLSVSVSAGETAGAITGTAIATVASLKTVFADWLKLTDDKTFDTPGMPQRADLDSDFSIAGNRAVLNLKTLSLGEPKVAGTVAYTTGARPLVNAKLAVNLLTLPVSREVAEEQAKKTQGKADDKKAADAPKKIDLDFDAPQLPFDLKFDVALDRLNRGDFVATDVRAAGDYDNKTLNLTTATATVSGGTISAAGKIADLKALSGIDMQAGLRTNDLENFVGAITGKPLELKQKIGDFAGSVKAKGDRKKMAVDATAQAQGYTITASGTLDDPFSPEIPGTMAVRIRHTDLVTAIRAFSPGFGNTAGGAAKPVDISGTAKINGKVYEFADMKGTLGASDIAGSLKADLSGSTPDISATINSKNLDVGALVGVDKKSTASTTAGKGGTVSATGFEGASSPAGQWSREALDTGVMKSVNADVKLNAGTLSYGTWVLTDAKAGVNLKNGVLKVSPLSGKLYGGTLDAGLDATSAGEGQPITIAFKADVSDVGVGPFLQALTSSKTKRADGTGSVKIDIKGAGVSSNALMNSLNGSIATKASTLVIYGMDIDKLAANIVEAFDGGWKGVLSGFTQSGFTGGQTKFKDFDQNFVIANGEMPIKNFKLETSNSNAIVITNGAVSFARWNMDLQSNVQVTQPKDVPVIGIRLAGPLDAPVKTVSSQALDNLVRTKLGDKVQDLIGKKLGNDSPVGGLINNFLGGSAAPAQTSGAVPATPAAPAAAPSSTITPAQPLTPPATEAAPVTPAPEEKKKTPQEQLLEGVLNQLSR